MSLLYLRSIWYVYGCHSYIFTQDIPDFMGFTQQSRSCFYKDKGFQNRATWHIALEGHKARELVVCNSNAS